MRHPSPDPEFRALIPDPVSSPRQIDREQRAALRAVGGGDAAAVQLDQVLDDGQTEAGAAGIALAAERALSTR